MWVEIWRSSLVGREGYLDRPRHFEGLQNRRTHDSRADSTEGYVGAGISATGVNHFEMVGGCGRCGDTGSSQGGVGVGTTVDY